MIRLLITAIMFLALVGVANATPPSRAQLAGVWEPSGYNNACPASLPSSVKGCLYENFWYNVEPTSSTFNWTTLDTSISRAKTAGYVIAVSIATGVRTPYWLKTTAGIVNINSTFDVDTGASPDTNGPEILQACQTVLEPDPRVALYQSYVQTLYTQFAAEITADGGNSVVVRVQNSGFAKRTEEVQTTGYNSVWAGQTTISCGASSTSCGCGAGPCTCAPLDDVSQWLTLTPPVTRAGFEAAAETDWSNISAIFPNQVVDTMIGSDWPAADANGTLCDFGSKTIGSVLQVGCGTSGAPFTGIKDTIGPNDVLAWGRSHISNFAAQQNNFSATFASPWIPPLIGPIGGQAGQGMDSMTGPGSACQALGMLYDEHVWWAEIFPGDATDVSNAPCGAWFNTVAAQPNNTRVPMP